MIRNIAALSLVALGMMASLGCNAGTHGCRNCRGGYCNPGCHPGRIGWQRGGLDHGRRINDVTGNTAPNAGASSGVTSAQTAYPYYTTRGPRDFLQNNPPTIGR